MRSEREGTHVRQKHNTQLVVSRPTPNVLWPQGLKNYRSLAARSMPDGKAVRLVFMLLKSASYASTCQCSSSVCCRLAFCRVVHMDAFLGVLIYCRFSSLPSRSWLSQPAPAPPAAAASSSWSPARQSRHQQRVSSVQRCSFAGCFSVAV